MVRCHCIDLGPLSIVVLTDQLVAALKDRVPLARRSTWLAAASDLVLLKARLLCPETLAMAAAEARPPVSNHAGNPRHHRRALTSLAAPVRLAAVLRKAALQTLLTSCGEDRAGRRDRTLALASNGNAVPRR